MNFYSAGGTLHADAPSYVERPADEELFQGLISGYFCYVLTARQMGKSSLMVRCISRLRKAGVSVASLDLTAVGQNVTPEQWYGGLLMQLGSQLALRNDLISFWKGHPDLGPLQRWMAMIRQIVLPRCPGRIVIFVDEIDVVRSLPFSVDEFFAGIRECYNSRSENPEMERLSFALLGVAAPTDLVRDTRLTPFNVGQRIELHDFSVREASPLARGLSANGSSAVLLKRILFWTGGHPYLTQRLCQAVSERSGIPGARGIDELCQTLFLRPRAQERDDNLLFVREHMLRSETDVASLLDLYRQIRDGARVNDDETNPLVARLQLSGIVRTENARLRVRNRIYSHVFDRKWIESNMPGAELRRQRRAYLRGLWRAAIVGVLVVAVVASLAVAAIVQLQTRQRLLYYSQMRLAKEKWESGEFDRVGELLQQSTPKNWQPDLRGFEWHLFSQLILGREEARVDEQNPIVGVTFSGEGKVLAIAESMRAGQSGNRNYLLKLLEWPTKKVLHQFVVPSEALYSTVAFLPNGEQVITDAPGNTAALWDMRTGSRLSEFKGHTARLTVLTLSPDGSELATADTEGTINIWRVAGAELKATLRSVSHRLTSLAFSPDGHWLAAADESAKVSLWDITTSRDRSFAAARHNAINEVVFFPDSRRVLATAKNGRMLIWDVVAGREIAVLQAHSGPMRAVRFALDGKLFATGGNDRAVKLWSTLDLRELKTIRGNDSTVRSIAWSGDGDKLVTGGQDNTVRVWNVRSGEELFFPAEHVSTYLATSFDDGQELLALGVTEDQQVKIWNLSTGREVGKLSESGNNILCGAFTSNGLLATGGLDKQVKLWDAATGHLLAVLRGHLGPVYALSFSADNRLLVSGGVDPFHILWDVAARQQHDQLTSEAGSWWQAGFSRDGKYLAYARRDGSVVIWDVGKRQEAQVLTGFGPDVKAIAFSPDGKTLATGGENDPILLTDVATGRQIASLGRAHGVQRAVFSRDGKRLITGSADGTVTVWDTLAGQELMNLPGHSDEVTSVTFSDDGLSLATSGSDGTVRLWRAQPPQVETPTTAGSLRPGSTAVSTGKP